MNDRTAKQRRQFVAHLENVLLSRGDAGIHELLRDEDTSELCALNGMASRRLQIAIQREIRRTDDL